MIVAAFVRLEHSAVLNFCYASSLLYLPFLPRLPAEVYGTVPDVLTRGVVIMLLCGCAYYLRTRTVIKYLVLSRVPYEYLTVRQSAGDRFDSNLTGV